MLSQGDRTDYWTQWDFTGYSVLLVDKTGDHWSVVLEGFSGSRMPANWLILEPLILKS